MLVPFSTVYCPPIYVRDELGFIRNEVEGAVWTAEPESRRVYGKEEGDTSEDKSSRSFLGDSSDEGLFFVAAFHGGREEEASTTGFTGGTQGLSAAVGFLSVKYFFFGRSGSERVTGLDLTPKISEPSFEHLVRVNSHQRYRV